MTNKQYIEKYAPVYLQKAKEQKVVICWWSFTAWLASFTFAGSFDKSDIDYAKQCIGLEA
jgi:hypothetical protein